MAATKRAPTSKKAPAKRAVAKKAPRRKSRAAKADARATDVGPRKSRGQAQKPKSQRRTSTPAIPFPEWVPRPGEEIGLSTGVAGRPKSKHQTRDWDGDDEQPASGGKKHGPRVSDMAKPIHRQMRRASDKGRRASAPRAER